MAATRLMRLLTVEQVAELTGWKAATIRNKCWRRELDYVKLGRNIRFREEVISKLISESEIPAVAGR